MPAAASRRRGPLKNWTPSFVVRDANGQALDCHINATTTRLTAVSVGIGLRRAAALLCAADWIKQEAQGAAGSLGGQTVRGFFI